MMKRLGAFALFCVFMAACGVKAPPVPRGYTLPAAAKDLSYAIEADNSVALTWTAPEPADENAFALGGAKIYRHKETLKTDACENCPILFSQIEDLPAGKRSMVFREALEKGFRYHYKVVMYDVNDMLSGDSNIVSFENP